MPDLQWTNFKYDIYSILRHFGATIYQRPAFKAASDQVGMYEGQAERAAAFVAVVETHQLEVLKAHLAFSARINKQEAIGLIVQHGTNTLVLAS